MEDSPGGPWEPREGRWHGDCQQEESACVPVLRPPAEPRPAALWAVLREPWAACLGPTDGWMDGQDLQEHEEPGAGAKQNS